MSIPIYWRPPQAMVRQVDGMGRVTVQGVDTVVTGEG